MIEGMLGGLQNFSYTLILFMTLGVLAGTIVGIIPGLGSLFVLALLLPFTFVMEPAAGLGILLAAATVIGTSNTVTSVLFGVPGNVSGIAVIFDGYPLAQKGEARRALTAGFTASAVGGVIGAVILALLLPLVRPLILALGNPEFFALILIALILMARVGYEDTLKGLVAGGMGLCLAFVGQERGTGAFRFTFGQLYLWDGIALVPLVIGLFAIAEMMNLIQSRETVAREGASVESKDRWRGFIDVFRHWKTTLRSTVTGAGVGLLPGLGGESAQFLAYAQAARLSKNGHRFGQGEIEGVIAADAATNAKDGASLIPTLVFGIPGSAPMAIILSALIVFGIQPGPSMLTTNLALTWTLIWVLIFSNLMAAGLMFSLAAPLSRLTRVRPEIFAPPILVGSLIGAYSATNNVWDIYVALTAGIVGFVMTKTGYSRAMLVIGFVLGPILEQNLLLAVRLHGLGFVWTRPLVIAILGFGAFLLLWPNLRGLLRRAPTARAKPALPNTAAEPRIYRRSRSSRPHNEVGHKSRPRGESGRGE